jgi:hypothetical protein
LSLVIKSGGHSLGLQQPEISSQKQAGDKDKKKSSSLLHAECYKGKKSAWTITMSYDNVTLNSWKLGWVHPTTGAS